MRDFVLLAPTFIVGAVVLIGVASDSHHSNNPQIKTYYLFLTFLFGVLFRWYQDKKQPLDRANAGNRTRPDPASLDLDGLPVARP